MIFWGLGQFYVKQVICRWIVAPLVIIQFVLKPRPAILKATTSDMLIKTNRSDKVAVFPLNTRMCNNYRSSCHSFNDFKSAASLIINQVASVLYSYLDLRGQGSKCMDWSNKKHLSQVHTPTPLSAETCCFFLTNCIFAFVPVSVQIVFEYVKINLEHLQVFVLKQKHFISWRWQRLQSLSSFPSHLCIQEHPTN